MGKYCRGKGNRPPRLATAAPPTVPGSRLMTFVLSFASAPPGVWRQRMIPKKPAPDLIRVGTGFRKRSCAKQNGRHERHHRRTGDSDQRHQATRPRRDRRVHETRRSGARHRRAHDPRGPDPAAAAAAARSRARRLDHHLGADPDDGAVHPHAARILLVPDRAADRHHVAAGAQPRLHPPHSRARPRRHRRRRPCDRGLRQFRDERQLRDRHHRVHDPGDREFRGHHQGLRPHRGSGRPLSPRRHAGQADGDRRRSLRRADRREGGAPAPPEARGRRRLLRRHGRRLQIRARRRHRRPAGGVHQRHRRHDHRHRTARPELCRRGAFLHHPYGRRRTGHPDPGADRLHFGRPAGVESRGRRRRRQGAAQAALRLSAGARHVGRGDGGDGAAAGNSHAAVPFPRRRRRRARLYHRQAHQGSPPRPKPARRQRRPKARRRTSRSPRRSRSTISKSSSAMRCCRWSIRPTAPTG